MDEQRTAVNLEGITDEKLHYIFQVGKTDHYFDDEIHFNWDEQISNSDLIKFYSPELELNILVSRRFNGGIVGYSIDEGFSEFLLTMGAKLIQYDFVYDRYNIKNSSVCEFELKDRRIIEVANTCYGRGHQLMINDITADIKTIATYHLPNGINFIKVFETTTSLKWIGKPEEDEIIAGKFRKIKRKTSFNPAIIIYLIVIVVCVLLLLR